MIFFKSSQLPEYSTPKEKFKALVSNVKLWKNLQKIPWKGFNKNGSVFYVLKSKKKKLFFKMYLIFFGKTKIVFLGEFFFCS